MTLLLVSGLLLVGFIFAAAYYEHWFGPGPTAAAPCTPSGSPTGKSIAIKPSQVKVNVYNASKRTGLARQVGIQMQSRGFTVPTVANDPLHATFKQPAVVRYGPKGKEAARLVAAEVQGSKLVQDKRKDGSVDLVLGATYSKLLVQTAGATSTPSSTCTPTTGTHTATSTSTTSSSKTIKPGGKATSTSTKTKK